MRKEGLIISLIAIIIVVGVTVFNRLDQPESRDQIVFGVITPLTGNGATRGQSVLAGLELAQESLSGEVEVEFVVEDVALDTPKEGVSAFQKLAADERIIAIIGPSGSPVVQAVSPLVDDAKIPIIVNAVSALSVTEDNDYLFRLWPTARTYGQAMTQEIVNRGYKNIGILASTHNNTKDLTEVLKELLPQASVEFVIKEVSFESKDFRTELLALKNRSHDAILLNLYPGQLGLSANQLRELGIALPIFTAAGTSKMEIEVAPQSLEGAWFPRFPGYTTDFKDKFIQKFGQEPSDPDNAAAAYDSFLILVEAITKTDGSSEAIKDYLYQNEFMGSVGRVSFQDSGDANIPISLFTVQDGVIVELE